MFDITESVVSLLGIPQQFDGAADLTGESSLTANGNVAFFVTAELVAESNVAADGVRITFAASNISFQANLTVGGNLVKAAASIILATSNLTAESTRLQFANPRAMRASSDLVATMLIAAPVAGRPMVGDLTMLATVYVPSKYLVLPTIELTYTDNVLLRRYSIDNGQSLLITNNVGVLQTFPAQEEIAEADYYFRGGATNILDDAALAAVEAAGYGQYVVTE